VTSFVNDKYRDVSAESICKRNSVLLLIFCGQKDFAQMPFTPRYVQYMVTIVLQDQQYMFGVSSLLVGEKALLMKKTWPMCCFND